MLEIGHAAILQIGSYIHLVYVNVKIRSEKILRAGGVTGAQAKLLKLRAFDVEGQPGPTPSSRSAGAPIGLPAERSIDAGELVEPFLDLFLLLLQQLDLLQALLPAQTQRLRVSIAFLGSDHLADFAKREAQLLALEDQRKPRPIALRIEPAQALAVRRDQSLVLVKPQRTQRHVELARQLADGEGSLAARLVSFRGLSSPHLCDRGFHVAGIIHFDSLAFVLRGFARPHGPLARR